MKKIKVLMQGFSGEIGLTYHLVRLAEGLKQQGIDVVLITTDREQVEGLKWELTQQGIKYYKSKFINKRPWNLLAVYKSMREIKSIVNSEHIDIIHTHGFLIPAYLASRSPVVRRKVPVVTTVNSFWHRTKAETFVCILESKLANLCSDIAMPVSEQLRQELTTFGVKPEKLRVVHWGIDLKKFDYDRSSQKYLSKYEGILQNLSDKVVIQSANLFPRKGIEFHLKAASKVLKVFPETKFLITGDGPSRNELKELTSHLGISKSIIFTGYVEDDFIPKIMSYASVGLVSSLLETFSIALIELMAAGKPVVATPVGVAPEIITPENDIGYIVPPKDPEALADAIIKLLDDPGKAREMGSRGRRLVEEKFTMNVMARRLKEVYEMAIEEQTQK